MKLLRRIFRVLSWTLAILFILALALLTVSENTPYQGTDFYKLWKNEIGSIKADTVSPSTIRVGWARANITPGSPGPTAGYGGRRGKHFTAVLDSVYVRVLAFDNGKSRSAIVTADLLLIPPSVALRLQKMLAGTALPFENVFFGATHTHNSVGGWGKGVSALFFSGTYDEKVEIRLAEAIFKAIQNAQSNLKPARFEYLEAIDSTDVRNRLVKTSDTIDAEIRGIRVEREDGSKGIFATYSAHSTLIDMKNVVLSRDWPGVLVDSLEHNGYDFAAYMAGAVGSMGPNARGNNDAEELKTQGGGVFSSLLGAGVRIEAQTKYPLQVFTLPLPLRAPAPRINMHLSLRPWVFRKAFGDYPTYVKALRLGNVLLVGFPCDFSGELTPDIDSYARSKGLNLIVTSFNGGYIGYVTRDDHYGYDAYESVTMNWYGGHNGSYFQEVVRDITNKLSF